MSNNFFPITVLATCVLIIFGTEALGAIVNVYHEEGTAEENLQSANINDMHTGSAVTMYSFVTTVRHRSKRVPESTDPFPPVGGVEKSLKEKFEDYIAGSPPLKSHHRNEYQSESGVHWHQNPTENTVLRMGSRIGQENEHLEPISSKSQLDDGIQQESSEYNEQHTDIGSSSSHENATMKDDALRRKIQGNLRGSRYPSTEAIAKMAARQSHGHVDRYSGSVTDKTVDNTSEMEDIHVEKLRPLPLLKHHPPENTETGYTYNIPPRRLLEQLHFNHMNSRSGASVDEGKVTEGRIVHQSSMSGMNGNIQGVRPCRNKESGLSLGSSGKIIMDGTSNERRHQRETVVSFSEDRNGNKDRIGLELSEILDKIRASAAASDTVASSASSGVVQSKPQMSLHEMTQRPLSSGGRDRFMHVLQDNAGTSTVRSDRNPDMFSGRFSRKELENLFGAIARISETNSEKNVNGMLRNDAGVTNSSEFIYIMVPSSLDMLKGVDWSSLISSFVTGNNTLGTVSLSYEIGGQPEKAYSAGDSPTGAKAEMKRGKNGSTSPDATYTLVPVGNYATTWSGLHRQLPYGNLATLGRSNYVTLPMVYNTVAMRTNQRITHHGIPFQLVTPRLLQSNRRSAAASQAPYYMLVNSGELAPRLTATSQQRPVAGVTYAASSAVVIPAQGYRYPSG